MRRELVKSLRLKSKLSIFGSILWTMHLYLYSSNWIIVTTGLHAGPITKPATCHEL